MKNRALMEAWRGWLDYCELQQMKKEQLAAAVAFWTHRELAAAFDEFRLLTCLGTAPFRIMMFRFALGLNAVKAAGRYTTRHATS